MPPLPGRCAACRTFWCLRWLRLRCFLCLLSLLRPWLLRPWLLWPEALVHFDILTGRAVPREIGAHAVLLQARPDLLVGVRGQRGAERLHQCRGVVVGK